MSLCHVILLAFSNKVLHFFKWWQVLRNSRRQKTRELQSHLATCLERSQHTSLAALFTTEGMQQTRCASAETKMQYLQQNIPWVCAKSLQSCPTLCDPMDCSPPGSSVHGILQARMTGVGCHFLLQGIFPMQGLNLHLLCLLHRRRVLHHQHGNSIPLSY